MKTFMNYLKAGGRILLLTILAICVLYGGTRLVSGARNVKDPAGTALVQSQQEKDVKAAVEIVRAAEESRAAASAAAADQAAAAAAAEEFKAQYNALLDAGTVTGLSDEEIAAFQQKFADTVFFGDSMTQAIAEYGISSEDRTIYLRGGTLDKLLPYMEDVQNIYPSRIIIWTGLNDCNHYMSDFEQYQNDLAALINAAAGICGAGNVYVCSLLPGSDSIAAVRDDLALAPTYNQYLQSTVAACGANYIDTTWIVRQSLYLDDHIHMDSTFYAVWARYFMT